MAARRAWYEFCVVYQRLPAERRKKVYQSKSTRAHLAQIARLPRRFGETLDQDFAPLRCYQFLASVPDRPELPRLVAQAARFEDLRAFFRQRRRWPLPHEILRLRRRLDDRLGVVKPEAEAQIDAAVPAVSKLVAAHAIAIAVQHQHPEIAAVLRLYGDDPEIAELLHSFAEQRGYRRPAA
jgi:hypothetical protein